MSFTESGTSTRSGFCTFFIPFALYQQVPVTGELRQRIEATRLVAEGHATLGGQLE